VKIRSKTMTDTFGSLKRQTVGIPGVVINRVSEKIVT